MLNIFKLGTKIYVTVCFDVLFRPMEFIHSSIFYSRHSTRIKTFAFQLSSVKCHHMFPSYVLYLGLIEFLAWIFGTSYYLCLNASVYFCCRASSSFRFVYFLLSSSVTHSFTGFPTIFLFQVILMHIYICVFYCFLCTLSRFILLLCSFNKKLMHASIECCKWKGKIPLINSHERPCLCMASVLVAWLIWSSQSYINSIPTVSSSTQQVDRQSVEIPFGMCLKAVDCITS
jgi:hypothetical protein